MSEAPRDENEPDRVARLEMRVAEGERVIEELSGEVARQWSAVERLERQVQLLADRFMSLEDALPPAQATKPPHW